MTTAVVTPSNTSAWAWPHEWTAPRFTLTPATTAPSGSTAAAATELSDSTSVAFVETTDVASLQSAVKEAFAELRRYQQYDAGWDGYWGRTFEIPLLRTARSILHLSYCRLFTESIVPDLITTGPASDGSLDIEIDVRSKRLFFTLYPDEADVRIAAFVGNGAREETAPLGKMALERWLDWLTDSNDLPPTMEAHQPDSG